MFSNLIKRRNSYFVASWRSRIYKIGIFRERVSNEALHLNISLDRGAPWAELEPKRHPDIILGYMDHKYNRSIIFLRPTRSLMCKVRKDRDAKESYKKK